MEKLTSSLQALSAEDAGGQAIDHVNDLVPAFDSATAYRPSLETLPVELQRLILSKVSTLQSLSAIVHASPQFHRIYDEDRVPILRLVLAETLGEIHIDAVGAYRSGADDFQKNGTEPMLWSFVEELTEKYKAPAGWTAELSFDDIIHIFRLHDSVIEPLTERYATWALASLPRSKEAENEHQPLSGTERQRIQRAMYRLQMFCHLCSISGGGLRYRYHSRINRLRVLFIFDPWEIEEILHIHAFAQDLYSVIYRQVVIEMNERVENIGEDWDSPDGSEDPLLICNDWTKDGYINPQSLNGILRDGLQILYGTSKTQTHESLVEDMHTMTEIGGVHGSRDWNHVWINHTVNHSTQEERREHWYSPRDSAQDWRHKMPFDGDRLDSPPLGWVLWWKGEYSNLVGDQVHFMLRRWGLVMWDAARLTTEAKEFIEFWSMQLWGLSDPREDDYDPSVAPPEEPRRGTQEWWDS